MISLKDGRNELYQWDTGCQVTVDAPVKQFHFAKPGTYGRTIDVDAVESAASIPDIMLQTAGKLSVYAWVDGKTKVEQTFTVKPRKRPADYVYTPADQTKLEKVIKIAEDLRRDADAGKFDGGYYKPGIEGDNLTFTGSKPNMPPVEPVPIPGGGGGSGGASKEYVDTAVDGVRKDIPTKTSQLQNDSGYLTEHQSLTDYAKKTDVPTKTSQLENDAKFVAADSTIQILPPVTSLEDAQRRGLDNVDKLPVNTRVIYVGLHYKSLKGTLPESLFYPSGTQKIQSLIVDTVGAPNDTFPLIASQILRGSPMAGDRIYPFYFRGYYLGDIPQEWVDLTDKLTQSDLQGGIDKALEDAKAKGIFDGKDGNDGKTPALSIGKVDTLAPESPATAEITGSVENLKLNLGIPQGKPGEGGAGGGEKSWGEETIFVAEHDVTEILINFEKPVQEILFVLSLRGTSAATGTSFVGMGISWDSDDHGFNGARTKDSDGTVWDFRRVYARISNGVLFAYMGKQTGMDPSTVFKFDYSFNSDFYARAKEITGIYVRSYSGGLIGKGSKLIYSVR